MAGAELATAYITIVSSAEGLGKSIIGEAQAGTAGAEAEGQKAGRSFASAFGIGAAAIGTVALAGAKGLYEVGAVFDDVSDTIRVGTGKSGAALDGLVKSAEAVGTTVPANFEKIGPVVAGLNQRLGLSGKTLETVASQYLEAGRILGQDIDIQGTTAAFTAFGIKGDAVSGAMDRLFQVSQATGVGFNELAGTMQSQAPALQTLGFSFDQTAGLIGNLDKAGLNAQAVVASMGKGLVKLAKDGEEPQAAFQRVTGQIGDLIKAGDTAKAIDLASGIFGTKGANQFVAAVQAGTIATGDLGAVAGATGDTILGLGAETGDFAEKWELFKNKTLVGLEPLGTKVFGALGQMMGKAADAVGPIIDKITTGTSSLFAKIGPGVKSALAGVATTLGPTIAGISEALGGVFGMFMPIFAQLGPIFAQIMPLFNPFGLLLKSLLPILPQLAQYVGLIATAIGNALFGALAALTPLLPTITNLLGTVVSVIANGVMSAVTALVPVVVLLIDAFSALMPTIVNLVQSILPPLAALITEIAPLVAALASVFADVLTVAIQALLPIVQTVFNAIGPVIEAAMQIIKGIIEVVTGIISGDWSKVWQGIKDFVGGIWDGIKAVISGALAVVGTILETAWTGIKTAASAAWELVKKFIIDPLDSAFNWVKTEFFKIIDWIDKNIWIPIKIAAEAAWKWVYDHIIGPLKDAIKWVEDTFSTIVGKVQKIWDDTKKVLSGDLSLNATLGLNGTLNNIPHLASGGYFGPTPGGHLAVVAEAGQAEVVSPVPLMDSVFRNALKDLDSAPTRSGWGSGEMPPIIVHNYGDKMTGEDVHEAFLEYERNYGYAVA